MPACALVRGYTFRASCISDFSAPRRNLSNWTTVGFSLISFVLIATSNFFARSTLSFIALIEVSPANWISVVTPNSLCPIASAMQSQIRCCISFFGGIISSTAFCGFGRARLLTFWFWFNGIRSICIVTAGAIYGGFVSIIKAFSFSVSICSSDTTYAAIYLPPPSSSNAATVASLIPG